MPTARDLRACHALLRQGSKSFSLAGRLLPSHVRNDAAVFYAFCRVADDLIDDGDAPSQALLVLEYRIERMFAGDPIDSPVDRCMADLIQRHDLPRAYLTALLEGFAWDAQGRLVETLADVTAYAVRVAGAVGLAMAWIMGTRSPHVLARACDLGVAMQFTNIARDVAEDAARGRVYLPQTWLRASGLDVGRWLQRPHLDARVRLATTTLIEHADALYARAETGIGSLPVACRGAIMTALLLYREIGHRVVQAGDQALAQRTYVKLPHKLALVRRGLKTQAFRDLDVSPPVAPAQHLLEFDHDPRAQAAMV